MATFAFSKIYFKGSSVLFMLFPLFGDASKPDHLPSRELYIRSFELATFVPLMQWHSEPTGGQFGETISGPDGVNDRSPWNMAALHGKEVGEICGRYSRLRERLRPYLETLGKIDEPIMRPMLYDFDEGFGNVFDQYMLGPSLLVAPALHEGQNRRGVSLPAGLWLDVSSRALVEGGGTFAFDCPIDTIGLFIRMESAYEDDLRNVFGV